MYCKVIPRTVRHREKEFFALLSVDLFETGKTIESLFLYLILILIVRKNQSPTFFFSFFTYAIPRNDRTRLEDSRVPTLDIHFFFTFIGIHIANG